MSIPNIFSIQRLASHAPLPAHGTGLARDVLATIAVALALTGPAAAQEFEANHMFVTDPDTSQVIEMDEDFEFVRSITDPGLVIPHALAFGPDGNLYVGSATGQILVFNGAGEKVRSISAGGGAAGLAFGHKGRLALTTGTQVRMLEIHKDPALPTMILDTGVNLDGCVFGYDGRLMVASPGAGGVLRIDMDTSIASQMDPILDDESGADNLAIPEAVAIASNGDVFVTDQSGDRIMRLAPNGVQVQNGTIFNFPDIDGIAVGPNQFVWVTSNQSGKVAMVDPALDGSLVLDLAPFGVNQVSAIAWSPARFKAKVTGKIEFDLNGEFISTKVKENVQVTYAPGSGTLMIAVDPEGLLVELSQGGAWVFHGFELGSASSLTRILDMSEWPSLSNVRGSSNLRVKATGVLAPHSLGEMYEPASISGRIARSGASASFIGKLKTKKRLN